MKTDLLEADVGSGESNENKTAEVVLEDKVKEIEQKTNGAENKEEVAPTPAEPEVSVAAPEPSTAKPDNEVKEEKVAQSSEVTASATKRSGKASVRKGGVKGQGSKGAGGEIVAEGSGNKGIPMLGGLGPETKEKELFRMPLLVGNFTGHRTTGIETVGPSSSPFTKGISKKSGLPYFGISFGSGIPLGKTKLFTNAEIRFEYNKPRIQNAVNALMVGVTAYMVYQTCGLAALPSILPAFGK